MTDVSFLETDAPVLAWDTEVFELEGMYTDFLKAVDTLSGGELDISRIEEDNSGVDWDKGSGRKNVSFTVMGADCDFSAAFEGDWMNVDIVKCVNDKLEDLGAGKRLLACFDGYQGIILFYNTPEWCESFNAAFPELPLGTSVDVSAGPLGFLFW